MNADERKRLRAQLECDPPTFHHYGQCDCALRSLLDRVEKLEKIVKDALTQAGCDGDLCMYQWHEDARAAIADGEERG